MIWLFLAQLSLAQLVINVAVLVFIYQHAQVHVIERDCRELERLRLDLLAAEINILMVSVFNLGKENLGKADRQYSEAKTALEAFIERHAKGKP